MHWPLCRVALALVLLTGAARVGQAEDTKAAKATATAPVAFEEILLADGYGYCYGLAPADLDGDGDLDLTSSDTKINFNFYWFENDGKGNFTRHFIKPKEEGWFERQMVGDINGDKLPDVVVVKNLDSHLVWFENSGQPAKDKEWKRHVITTDFTRAYDVAILDINGDGLNDVAGSCWKGNHCAWFENPGKNAAGEWKKHPIDNNTLEARTMRVADFNGDGKLDVLATARESNLTAWYDYPGDPNKEWTRHVIDDKTEQPVHGEPSDMDGDGDMDVVLGTGMIINKANPKPGEIVWYENVGKKGTGKEWKKHVVSPLLGGFEAVAGDLDSDGDQDIVGTAWGGDGAVWWYENTGDPTKNWKAHLLKSPWRRANQAVIADFNGDKRPDIAASAEEGSNEVRWWKNLGPKK